MVPCRALTIPIYHRYDRTSQPDHIGPPCRMTRKMKRPFLSLLLGRAEDVLSHVVLRGAPQW